MMMHCEDDIEAGSNAENVAVWGGREESRDPELSTRCYWVDTPHFNLLLPGFSHPYKKSNGLQNLGKPSTEFLEMSRVGAWIPRRNSLACCTNELKPYNYPIWLQKAEVPPTCHYVPLNYVIHVKQLVIHQHVISNTDISNSFKTKILNLFHLTSFTTEEWPGTALLLAFRKSSQIPA